MQITAVPVRDFSELGRVWRELEARDAAPPFFRGWTWTGCLAEERFPDPLLLRATDAGELVGLAIFNRRAGRLCLGESGDAALDAPFVEHNGPLLHPRHRSVDLVADLLRTALAQPGVRRLVLGGVDAAVLAAAPGVRLRAQERAAPWVDLDAVRGGCGDHLSSLSANARYQLRRSFRALAQPDLRSAETLETALEWLEDLMRLHELRWRASGKPGAFATPWLRRFHRELVSRGHPRGEVEVLRLAAAGEIHGYLYNFRHGGRTIAYQSGMAATPSGSHGKPGLTAHALAIQLAIDRGDAAYDFLAGAHRYKSSLANAVDALHWAEYVPSRSVVGIGLRAARAIGLLPGR